MKEGNELLGRVRNIFLPHRHLPHRSLAAKSLLAYRPKEIDLHQDRQTLQFRGHNSYTPSILRDNSACMSRRPSAMM